MAPARYLHLHNLHDWPRHMFIFLQRFYSTSRMYKNGQSLYSQLCISTTECRIMVKAGQHTSQDYKIQDKTENKHSILATRHQPSSSFLLNPHFAYFLQQNDPSTSLQPPPTYPLNCLFSQSLHLSQPASNINLVSLSLFLYTS